MIACCYLQFIFFHLVMLVLKENTRFFSVGKCNVTMPKQLDFFRDLHSI